MKEKKVDIEGWKYYNHAAVPTCAPHEEPNLEPIKNGLIWKMEGNPLLARWTSDWNCEYETNWWYTVQDKPFNIMSLNANNRKKITRGLKHFNCMPINPCEYAEDMADIALNDFETYPVEYRPKVSRDDLIEDYKNWNYITHGAFDINDGKLCAFHGIKDNGTWYEMIQGKSLPEKQNDQVNAALIYTYVMDISKDYKNGKYLTNGQRNLNHKTNFNENLCDRYGFRKVYCRLHVAYNPKIKWIVKIAYPFRKMLIKLDNQRLFHNLNVVLKMEELVREYE
jgi:hypothetical protein